MIKCAKCKRQTKEGEATGTFNIIRYKNTKDKKEGTRIVSSVKTCMNCSGEKLKK